MTQERKNIAIIGSGLVGSLLAIYLKRYGHRITVFDRRPDIRNIEFSGRSINLAMSNRGWNALKAVGLEEEIKTIAIPLDKRAMHVIGKPEYYQKYGKDGEAIWSISRGVLNRKMIDLAEKNGVDFRFEEKVWDIDLPEAKIFTGESEKGEWKEYEYDLVFGCDGAFSRVRHKMQRRSRFDYSQDFIDVGYKELTIPANSDGTHKLDKNSFHIWPRGKFMFIAMPNLDGSFTCTLFMPFEGDVSFESIKTKQDAVLFFTTYFPNVKNEIENLTEDFFKNPTSAMVTMKCYPWTYWNKVALVGDSAHAVVPFYGQGMNAGFEDIYVLDQIIQELGNDWEKIFQTYQERRKPNADAIAELSYRNFVEMSSKTADANFLLQKKIEKHFASKYPDKWVPAYSRVTFSLRPYAEALAEGDAQEAIMKEVMKMPDLDKKWDSREVEEKILELLG
ncbi:NAD(P)/FAD-dependent oxidoreductase [Maribacter confluentis]|uniref:Kynurenine 3-monooxygenase n=2 Tax=Maribacter TaxID=252356 RepID=A0ABY1SME6_9FLAO|nr:MULTISPECIES: NAD(P)/FAD-dependent oxidoreductase [Maribacter]MDO1511925.1 NAD(P)/FAD-dependent oxidoreductase [Maribacter confluentis]TVZ15191.1 kynurenine 3-monooxygenase [Maribacter sp. MAR_2009_72]SNR79143.1 kynurenine 3-monooxygenase [Maribacter sedimenticola]